MHLKSEPDDSWEKCPGGTLKSVAARSRRQRLVKRAALAIPLTAVLLLALTWSGYLPSPMDLNSSPLVCDQVVKLLPAYASNSLSATQRAQVEQHLKKCFFCRAKLEAIESAQAVAADLDASPRAGLMLSSGARSMPFAIN